MPCSLTRARSPRRSTPSRTTPLPTSMPKERMLVTTRIYLMQAPAACVRAPPRPPRCRRCLP